MAIDCLRGQLCPRALRSSSDPYTTCNPECPKCCPAIYGFMAMTTIRVQTRKEGQQLAVRVPCYSCGFIKQLRLCTHGGVLAAQCPSGALDFSSFSFNPPPVHFIPPSASGESRTSVLRFFCAFAVCWMVCATRIFVPQRKTSHCPLGIVMVCTAQMTQV